MILWSGFPQLRICTVVGFDSLTSNSAWSGCPSLRVLILNLPTPFDYESIRSLCFNVCPHEISSSCSFDPQKGVVWVCSIETQMVLEYLFKYYTVIQKDVYSYWTAENWNDENQKESLFWNLGRHLIRQLINNLATEWLISFVNGFFQRKVLIVSLHLWSNLPSQYSRRWESLL